MSGEGGEVPPDEDEYPEPKPQPSRMMDHLEKRTKTMGPRRSTDADQERVIVDRTALEAILDISSRIQDIQKKSRVSMSTLALAHESYKDKQVNKLQE